jgi:hypothetical protein
VLFKIAFGVPEITHVLAFTVAQVGSAVVPVLMAHPVIVAPLVASVVGDMDMAVPNVPFVPAAPE